jgi:Tol biopolymer transport system component
MSSFVYPSWHPNGKLIAYSVNKIEQMFHSGNGSINVYDKASDLVVYDVEKNIVTTSPLVSTKWRENVPSWSPKGDYLYYISAPAYVPNGPDSINRYSLLRIPFNVTNNSWGKPDTLIKAYETGRSVTYPEVSPDGKFLVFNMSDQGYFTVFNESCDLYIMDPVTLKYSKLPVNSNRADSFHSWSSNSRWLMFVSKRLDGLYSQVYFTYIDSNGKASKPFILPQKDPDFYTTYTLNYNRPVFVKGEVKISANTLSQAAFEKAIDVQFDHSVDIDALSGATRYEKQEKRDITTEHTN